MRRAGGVIVGVAVACVCAGAWAQQNKVADFLLPQVAQKLLLPDDKWSWERGKDGKAVLVFTAKNKEEAGEERYFGVRFADVDKRLTKQLGTGPYMVTVVFEGKFDVVGIQYGVFPRLLYANMAELKDKEPLSGEFEISLYREGGKEKLFLGGRLIKEFNIQRTQETGELCVYFKLPKDTEKAVVKIKTLKIEF